jgi:hypothetical protein
MYQINIRSYMSTRTNIDPGRGIRSFYNSKAILDTRAPRMSEAYFYFSTPRDQQQKSIRNTECVPSIFFPNRFIPFLYIHSHSHTHDYYFTAAALDRSGLCVFEHFCCRLQFESILPQQANPRLILRLDIYWRAVGREARDNGHFLILSITKSGMKQ